jgi:hypothetical protein
MLVWNMGCLEMYPIKDQLCCIPRLCMAELLPMNDYDILVQQSGWLIISNWRPYTHKYTQQEYQQCILYDVRRGRLVASFAVKKDIKPIIGKATPDKVQIYYGCIMPMSTEKTSDIPSYQYYWYIIELSIKSDISTNTEDIHRYEQTISQEKMKRVREKYHMIKTCVIEQGYWCDENYSLSMMEAKEAIYLPGCISTEIRTYHLVDDLFLISYKESRISDDAVFLAHSIRQQHVVWSRTTFKSCLLIPDEKAILFYEHYGMTQLLDMYTGNILNAFKIKLFGVTGHIIGPICCCTSTRENVLIDVRTGKEIRTLDSSRMTRYLTNQSIQAYMENNYTLPPSTPTRVEYSNWIDMMIWVDEYAQI